MRIWAALRWGLLGATLPLSACDPPQHALPPRAAFDLNCPEDGLSIVEIDAHTRGVRGCGQQAVYRQTCSSGSLTTAHCSWTLDPGSRTAIGWPALPTATSPVNASSGIEPPATMAEPAMTPSVEPVLAQPSTLPPPPPPSEPQEPSAPTPTVAPVPTVSAPAETTSTGSFPPTE